MRLEYGTVTSVFSDPALGGQLCHVKSNLSNREFQNCEIITGRGHAYLPKAGDIVLVSEIHNGEIVVLGVLTQEDLGLTEGQVGLVNPSGTGKIIIDTDGSIKFTAAKMGFFGSSVVQPIAIADSTASAGSVSTQLNLLLASLRSLGIIKT